MGNSAGKDASLPLSTLIPGYNDKRMVSLGIASATAVTLVYAAQASAEQAARFDWKRLGLWAVLLTGVDLLLLMALSVLRAKPTAP
jgi:hypothetical protein